MEESLPQELLEEYKQAFQILDRKNCGMISLNDLSTVTCSIGIKLSEAELRTYVTQITGAAMECCDAVTCLIDFKNFLVLMAVILTECISGEEVLRIFKEFDKDDDGFISPSELRNLLSRYGHEATDQEVEEMMNEADQDGDGMVSLHEFVTVMSTSNLMQTRILTNLLPPSSGGDDSDEPEHSSSSCKSGPHMAEIKEEAEEDDNDIVTSSSSECECDDVMSLVCHEGFLQRRKRRRSVVDWLKNKSKTLKTTSTSHAGAGGNTNKNTNNSNNNNSNSKKMRRVSISQKLSITMDMLKRQVKSSNAAKLNVIPDDDEEADN